MAYQMKITGDDFSEGLKVLSSQEVKDGFSSINVKEFMDNFLDVLKNKYFCFEGTTGRKIFWRYMLVLFVVEIIVSVLTTIVSIILSFAGLAFIGTLLSLIINLALLCPTLGITARRLHDMGRSGWLQVIGIIPVIGELIVLVLCLNKGVEGACGCGCGCEQK